ncbi:hypothetical protein CEUSTIGMA_g13351.t1 [Chlamydomonas eustigma]|uniref:Uncharacterized protein n=1 Tax=Chlamydomonas eustigma TaxID=1157962 RepID=A0A250XSA6_9CHLO|nr:hypothetical protein CEUSTIGMA_g13351.t1 [Chlamydomonas eustigma]|eukprot:GAX85935.1 hypothetical protein CEUSTIGMA_g13351.t1 [Chlamydomonas eustigma]
MKSCFWTCAATEQGRYHAHLIALRNQHSEDCQSNMFKTVLSRQSTLHVSKKRTLGTVTGKPRLSPCTALQTTLSPSTKTHMAAAQWYAWKNQLPEIQPQHILLGILSTNVPSLEADMCKTNNNTADVQYAPGPISNVLAAEGISITQVVDYVATCNYDQTKLSPLKGGSATLKGGSAPVLSSITPSAESMQLLQRAKCLAFEEGTDIIQVHHISKALIDLHDMGTNALDTVLTALSKNKVATYAAMYRAIQQVGSKNEEHEANKKRSPTVSHLSANNVEIQQRRVKSLPESSDKKILAMTAVSGDAVKRAQGLTTILDTMRDMPGLGPGLDLIHEMERLVATGGISSGPVEEAWDLILRAIDAGMFSAASSVTPLQDMCKVLSSTGVQFPTSKISEVCVRLCGPNAPAAFKAEDKMKALRRSLQEFVQQQIQQREKKLEKDRMAQRNYHYGYHQVPTHQEDQEIKPEEVHVQFPLWPCLQLPTPTTVCDAYIKNLSAIPSSASPTVVADLLLSGWRYDYGPFIWSRDDSSSGHHSKRLCLPFMFAASRLFEHKGDQTAPKLSAKASVSLLVMLSSIMHENISADNLNKFAAEQSNQSSTDVVLRNYAQSLVAQPSVNNMRTLQMNFLSLISDHFHTCALGPPEILSVVKSLAHMQAHPGARFLRGFARHIVDYIPAMTAPQLCDLLDELNHYNYVQDLEMDVELTHAFLSNALGPASPVIPGEDGTSRTRAVHAVLCMGWPLSDAWIAKLYDFCLGQPPSYMSTSSVVMLQRARGLLDRSFIAKELGLSC